MPYKAFLVSYKLLLLSYSGVLLSYKLYKLTSQNTKKREATWLLPLIFIS